MSSPPLMARDLDNFELIGN